MSQLRQLLQSSEAVRIAASVEGLPGIGKTELALQLVYQLARDRAFPGGIFWFNAENPDLHSAWGGTVADALGVPHRPIEERAAQVLRSVNRRRAPTLLCQERKTQPCSRSSWRKVMQRTPSALHTSGMLGRFELFVGRS